MSIPLQTKNDPRIKPALMEFEDVYRYWDSNTEKTAVKLQPGQCYVTKNDEIITTILGSCVAACILDPIAGVGGMNHFMLPKQSSNHRINRGSLSNPELCYGNWAMEFLINSVIKHGGAKNRLQIKIFGGANVIPSMRTMNVGDRNIEFVESWLANDGLAVDSSDLGGDYPRKVVFFPLKGNVKMKKMQTETQTDLVKEEERYMQTLAKKPADSNIELF